MSSPSQDITNRRDGAIEEWAEDDALPPPPRSEIEAGADPMSVVVERMLAAQANLSQTDLLDDKDRSDFVWPTIPYHEILRVLGKGGMGVVFLARDTRIRRLVAIKVLAVRAMDDEDRQRFQMEAESAANLRHPNIITVHEVGRDPDLPYFVEDYIEAGSLADRLRQAPLEVKEAAAIVESLARAVEFAHRAGVLHRDIKPSNVLLRANPEGGAAIPVLSDFGLARRLDADVSRTRTGVVLGTPSYMPPEQASGNRNLGPTADVYSLGATLYEMLVGSPPFKAASLLEILEQVRTADPVSVRRLRPTVPKDLETICSKCLEKDPGKRYSSAGELAEDLRRLREQLPIHARPISPLDRFRKWNRRQPVIATLVYFAASSLFVGAVGIALHNQQLRHQVDRAEAGERLALEQKTIAEKNYLAASETLEKMMSRLDDVRLADVPGLESLRRQLQEDSLSFFETLMRERQDSSSMLKKDAARAAIKAASLQVKLGQTERALENGRRGIDQLSELLAADPQDVKIHAALSIAYMTYGFALSAKGDRKLMMQNYEFAKEHGEQVVRQSPEVPEYKSQLAQLLQNFGAEQIIENRSADAKANFKRSIQLREELAKAGHDNSRDRGMLADAHINLGLMFSNEANVALDHFQRAEQILVPLLRDHPQNLESANSLGGLYTNWGRLLGSLGKTTESYKKLAESIELLAKLRQKEPELRSVQVRLMNAHGSRAIILESEKRYRDAASDWEEVAKYCDSVERERYRVNAALASFRGGDSAAAVAIVQKLAGVDVKDPVAHYNLACLYSLLAGSINPADRSKSQSAQLEFDRLAILAVKQLVIAKEKQMFRDVSKLDAFRTDTDFDPIRNFKDFRNFAASLVPGRTASSK